MYLVVYLEFYYFGISYLSYIPCLGKNLRFSHYKYVSCNFRINWVIYYWISVLDFAWVLSFYYFLVSYIINKS